MNRHQIISVCLLTSLLGGYWFGLAKRELTNIKSLETRIRGLHSSQSLSEIEAQKLFEYQVAADEARGWLEGVVAAHTVEGAATDFLLQVDAELSACRLTARNSKPGPVVERELVKEQSLELWIEGTPQNLLEFLRRIEAGQPFCRVVELRVDAGLVEGSVRADLVITRLWRES